MKFSVKMIIGTTIIIAVLFSAGGTYMVEKNFDVAYNSAIESNTKEHILRRYSLEASVRNAIESGKEYSKELVSNYSSKMQSYADEDASMMVYDESGNLYSNVDEEKFVDIKDYISKDDTYRLYKNEDEIYMVISSKITIADDEFIVLNLYNISNVFSEKHRQLVMLFRLDIIIILISIVCIYVLSLILTVNIKKMIKSSKRIAEGNYDERTLIKSKDEIGELSKNFDSMAEAVEHHIDKLNLDVQNREDFVSNFSHELKTPMTAMMGYSKMLLDDNCDDETKKKAVNYIYKEGKRLEILSQKLLSMLGIASDEIKLGNVYCKWLSEQVKNTVKPFMNNVKLVIDVEECCINGDAALLIDLFKNLIENSVRACKSKDEGKYQNEITFTGKISKFDNSKKKYVFTVKDNGIGISDDEIGKITNAFYMIDKSRSRDAGGSGLGLAICERICHLHNTELKINSVFGEGTSVEVEVVVSEEDN